MNMLSPEAQIADFLRLLKWLAFALAGFWIIGMLAPVLTPFALALFLAWLGNPLVHQIERRGRSRIAGVALVFTLMIALLVLALMILIPLVERQVVTLIDVLPQLRDWAVSTAIPWIEKRTNLELMAWLDPERLVEWIRAHWQQAGGIAKTLFGYVSRSGFAMMTWSVNLVLLPVLTFYFLRDWDKIVEGVAAVIPRGQVTTATQLATEANQVLSAFIRGQFLVMLSLGAIYAVGLTLVGLNLGLLIGIVAGLISFIPYLGATTGILLAIIAVIMQAHGLDGRLLVLVGTVFAIGQMMESYLLTPRIVGDKIGLHPVTVIFAVMAGGQLFGFLGMLLALPVSAVTNVLLRYAHEQYRKSDLYGRVQSTIENQHQRDQAAAKRRD